MRSITLGLAAACLAAALATLAPGAGAQEPAKPNILVSWGDDIGQFNVSLSNRGMMGYRTPNIDRIAAEGVLFTDWYAQQSCTTGRAAFGNSDGDVEMLEYTTSGKGRRLGVIVRHDDAAREFAYDRDSPVGRLARGLDEAAGRGWTVVAMRDDWHRVFRGATTPGTRADPRARASRARHGRAEPRRRYRGGAHGPRRSRSRRALPTAASRRCSARCCSSTRA